MSGYFYSGSRPSMARRAAAWPRPKNPWAGVITPLKPVATNVPRGEAKNETPFVGSGWTPNPTAPPLTGRERALAAIKGDPEYIGGLSNLNTWLEANRRNMSSSIAQGVIGLGYDPRTGDPGSEGAVPGGASSGFDLGAYGEVLTPEVLAQAASNPFSMRAQLQQQRVGAMRDLTNELAARGMVRSGAAQTGGNQIRNTYNQQSSQALQQLLGTLQGNLTQSAGAELQQRNDWLAKKAAIAQRLGASDWAGSIA